MGASLAHGLHMGAFFLWGVSYSNGIDFPLLSWEGVQRGNNLPPKPGLSGPAQLRACLFLVPLAGTLVA